MKEFVITLISTNKGWITRQTLKWLTIGAASATTWLVSKDLPADSVAIIVGGVVTITSGLIELALSKMASSVATPQ